MILRAADRGLGGCRLICASWNAFRLAAPVCCGSSAFFFAFGPLPPVCRKTHGKMAAASGLRRVLVYVGRCISASAGDAARPLSGNGITLGHGWPSRRLSLRARSVGRATGIWLAGKRAHYSKKIDEDWAEESRRPAGNDDERRKHRSLARLARSLPIAQSSSQIPAVSGLFTRQAAEAIVSRSIAGKWAAITMEPASPTAAIRPTAGAGTLKNISTKTILDPWHPGAVALLRVRHAASGGRLPTSAAGTPHGPRAPSDRFAPSQQSIDETATQARKRTWRFRRARGAIINARPGPVVDCFTNSKPAPGHQVVAA